MGWSREEKGGKMIKSDGEDKRNHLASRVSIPLVIKGMSSLSLDIPP